MQTTEKLLKTRSRDSEKGSTIVALVLVAFVVLLVATASMKSSFLRLKSLHSVATRYSESVKAESGANTLEAVVKKRLGAAFTQDASAAQNCPKNGQNLSYFDASGVSGSQPLMVGGACREPGGNTSLLGNLNSYLESKKSGLEQEARGTLNTTDIQIKIAALEEAARMYGGTGEPSYMLAYTIDAVGGTYGRARRQGKTVFAVNQSNCGVYATIEAVNNSIILGSSATLRVTFSYATRIRIFNSANVVVYDQNTTETNGVQTLDYNFSPSATNSYRVEADGAGNGCRSVSSVVQITVTNPAELCPTVNSFSSSATNVYIGDSVTISWNITNGTGYTLEGVAIAPNGSQNFVINGARTFTLRATNASNSCPVERQVTINASPRPPCAPTPSIDAFSANPASVQVGSGTRLIWNISSLQGANVVITNTTTGANYAVNSSSGYLDIPAGAINSPGNYNFRIRAVNTCTDGTQISAERDVAVQVTACPAPSIADFTVNPGLVTIGGNQTVTFNWNASSACAANVSIDNGVGGSFPLSGAISIGQPQATTTYTLTVSNSSGAVQRQVTVSAQSPPPVSCTWIPNPVSVQVYSDWQAGWRSINDNTQAENFRWRGTLSASFWKESDGVVGYYVEIIYYDYETRPPLYPEPTYGVSKTNLQSVGFNYSMNGNSYSGGSTTLGLGNPWDNSAGVSGVYNVAQVAPAAPVTIDLNGDVHFRMDDGTPISPVTAAVSSPLSGTCQ